MNEQMRHRYVQRYVAQTCWENTRNVRLTEEMLKMEAAFRVWLRSQNLSSTLPMSLPCDRLLEETANECDSIYGENAWWSWPIWSSCDKCKDLEEISCRDCKKLSSIFEDPQ